jgi:hypothetical protein
METQMRLARLLGLLAVALLFVPYAYADGPVSMTFTGVNGANDGSYYVSPYYGVMSNGTSSQSVVLFCDDFNNEVYFGETWKANVTNLGTALSTNDFSNTRYGGVPSSPVYSNAGVAYEEAAYLVSQFASHPNDLVSLQYALWDIMNPGLISSNIGYGDVSTWLGQAQTYNNYSSINPYNYEIVTNVGPLCLTGQVQEFIVDAPEPGSLALLLCGLLALGALTISRARLAA